MNDDETRGSTQGMSTKGVGKRNEVDERQVSRNEGELSCPLELIEF